MARERMDAFDHVDFYDPLMSSYECLDDSFAIVPSAPVTSSAAATAPPPTSPLVTYDTISMGVPFRRLPTSAFKGLVVELESTECGGAADVHTPNAANPAAATATTTTGGHGQVRRSFSGTVGGLFRGKASSRVAPQLVEVLSRPVHEFAEAAGPAVHPTRLVNSHHPRMFFQEISSYFMCGKLIAKSANASIYDAVPIGYLPDSITSVDLVLRIPNRGRPAYLENWELVREGVKRFGSPHVFAPIAIDSTTSAIIMPKARGDLWTFIYEHQISTMNQRFVAAAHVCRSVRDFHGMGLAHRDVKPENIFLTSTGFYALADLEFVTKSRQVPLPKFAGTPRYVHPVLFNIFVNRGTTGPSSRKDRLRAKAKDWMDGVIWVEAPAETFPTVHPFAQHQDPIPAGSPLGEEMAAAEGIYELPVGYDPFVADIYATLITLIEVLVQDSRWGEDCTRPVSDELIDQAMRWIGNHIDQQLRFTLEQLRCIPDIAHLYSVYTVLCRLANSREGAAARDQEQE